MIELGAGNYITGIFGNLTCTYILYLSSNLTRTKTYRTVGSSFFSFIQAHIADSLRCYSVRIWCLRFITDCYVTWFSRSRTLTKCNTVLCRRCNRGTVADTNPCFPLGLCIIAQCNRITRGTCCLSTVTDYNCLSCFSSSLIRFIFSIFIITESANYYRPRSLSRCFRTNRNYPVAFRIGVGTDNNRSFTFCTCILTNSNGIFSFYGYICTDSYRIFPLNCCRITQCNRFFTFNCCFITNSYCIYCTITCSTTYSCNISLITNCNCTACSCNLAIITNRNSIIGPYIIRFIPKNRTPFAKCDCTGRPFNLSMLADCNTGNCLVSLRSPIVIYVCSGTNGNRILWQSIGKNTWCDGTSTYRSARIFIIIDRSSGVSSFIIES